MFRLRPQRLVAFQTNGYFEKFAVSLCPASRAARGHQHDCVISAVGRGRLTYGGQGHSCGQSGGKERNQKAFVRARV